MFLQKKIYSPLLFASDKLLKSEVLTYKLIHLSSIYFEAIKIHELQSHNWVAAGIGYSQNIGHILPMCVGVSNTRLKKFY